MQYHHRSNIIILLVRSNMQESQKFLEHTTRTQIITPTK